MTTYSESSKACPNGDGTTAVIVSRWDDDEDTGNEYVRYRCESGYEWQQPARQQVIRSIGFGMFWREFRDKLRDEWA